MRLERSANEKGVALSVLYKRFVRGSLPMFLLCFYGAT